MKAIKNLFAVLVAAALVFSFAACSDDDDDEEESRTLNFSLDSTSGKFLSQEFTETYDGETVTYQYYVSIDDSSKAWEVGTYISDSDDSTTEKEFKGTYTVSGSTYTLTKTHFYGYDLDATYPWTHKWIESKAENWKSFTVADNKFSVTLYESDYAELNANDDAAKAKWEED